jgi:cobalamin biosynthesis protein CobD/CbiB
MHILADTHQLDVRCTDSLCGLSSATTMAAASDQLSIRLGKTKSQQQRKQQNVAVTQAADLAVNAPVVPYDPATLLLL